jgi:ABC-type sugar transport system permease subunit
MSGGSGEDGVSVAAARSEDRWIGGSVRGERKIQCAATALSLFRSSRNTETPFHRNTGDTTRQASSFQNSKGLGEILEGSRLNRGAKEGAKTGFVVYSTNHLGESVRDRSEADFQRLQDVFLTAFLTTFLTAFLTTFLATFLAAFLTTFLTTFLAAFLTELLCDSHG